MSLTGDPDLPEVRMTLGLSTPHQFEKMEMSADAKSNGLPRMLHPFLKASAAEATTNQSPAQDSNPFRAGNLEALQGLAADFLKMVKDERKEPEPPASSSELRTQPLFRTVPTSMAKPPLGTNPMRRFGAQRQNSLRFRTNPPENVDVPRPIAVPPNMFSPSMTLESPILLRSSQAEPSPTTGTFPLPPFFQGGGPSALSSSPRSKEQQEAASQQGFVFLPFHNRMLRTDHNQTRMMSPLSGQAPPGQPSSPVPFFNSSISPQYQQHPARPPLIPRPTPVSSAPPALDVLEPADAPEEWEKPSEDGYNWRKYGQKQVKGSQYPRSYYKCTHPGCDVKKKVERSKDGKVAENTYKGTHTHPMPAPARRFFQGSPSTIVSPEAVKATQEIPGEKRFPEADESIEEDGNANVDSTSEQEIRNRIEMLKRELNMVSAAPSLRIPDAPKEPPDLNKNASPLTATPPRSAASSFESGEGRGVNSERKRGADEGEEVTQSSKKARTNGPQGGSKSRVPRVVVQTTSDVDLLDDGFRWRKYGQKQVKDNKHPRSYYKCTTQGCPVRKHVERSANDIRAVITTYEGKHNHELPPIGSHHHENRPNTPPLAAGTTTSLTRLLNSTHPPEEQGKQISQEA